MSYMLLKDHFSTNASFCTCDGISRAFPIIYSSPGFKDLFQFSNPECCEKGCGSLIGRAAILAKDANLVKTASAYDLTPECVAQAIDIHTTYIVEAVNSLMASSSSKQALPAGAIVVCQKKSGELLPTSVLMLRRLHPTLACHYFVGMQFDVTETISVRQLLKVTSSAEYDDLVSSGPSLAEHMARIQHGISDDQMFRFFDDVVIDAVRDLGPEAPAAIQDFFAVARKQLLISGEIVESPFNPPCRVAHPVVAVVRHAERADATGVWGDPWFNSKDQQEFPFDPPITRHGIAQARAIAARLREHGEYHVVVSSPYFRCVQTANVIAERLGVKVLLDYELAEVFGSEVFGEEPPTGPPWRPVCTLARSLDSWSGLAGACRATRLHWARILGQPPKWPETIGDAACRFARRYLTYLIRSRTTRRNCVIVTHGFMIQSCLRMMPATALWDVSRVEHCGCMMARYSGDGAEMGGARVRRRAETDNAMELDRYRQTSLHGGMQNKNEMFTEAGLQWWDVKTEGVSHDSSQVAASDVVRRKLLELLGPSWIKLEQSLGTLRKLKIEQNSPSQGSTLSESSSGQSVSSESSSLQHFQMASQTAPPSPSCLSQNTMCASIPDSRVPNVVARLTGNTLSPSKMHPLPRSPKSPSIFLQKEPETLSLSPINSLLRQRRQKLLWSMPQLDRRSSTSTEASLEQATHAGAPARLPTSTAGVPDTVFSQTGPDAYRSQLLSAELGHDLC